MRAILMTAVGGPEVLQLVELPEPEITAVHDVRVRLRAAGINPVDYKLRSGGTIGGALPAILGWDGAGVVESVGAASLRSKESSARGRLLAAPRAPAQRASSPITRLR
jgi:NADPH2:quinone reductase